MNEDFQLHGMQLEIQRRVADQRNHSGCMHAWDMNDEQVLKAQPQILEQLPSFTDCSDDRSKVVVEQDDRIDFTSSSDPNVRRSIA